MLDQLLYALRRTAGMFFYLWPIQIDNMISILCL